MGRSSKWRDPTGRSAASCLPPRFVDPLCDALHSLGRLLVSGFALVSGFRRTGTGGFLAVTLWFGAWPSRFLPVPHVDGPRTGGHRHTVFRNRCRPEQFVGAGLAHRDSPSESKNWDAALR